MSHEQGPSCDRHDAEVPMRLQSMHSDDARPDTILGLYECPECGHERRIPIDTKEAA